MHILTKQLKQRYSDSFVLTSFECKAAVFLGWSQEGWETGCETGERRTSEETHENFMTVLGPWVRRLGEKIHSDTS